LRQRLVQLLAFHTGFRQTDETPLFLSLAVRLLPHCRPGDALNHVRERRAGSFGFYDELRCGGTQPPGGVYLDRQCCHATARSCFPFNILTAVNDKEETDEEALQTLKVERNVMRFSDESPKERSAHGIHSNYREGFEQGGFEILFACAATECGRAWASSRAGVSQIFVMFPPGMRYIAATGTRDGQDIYVAVLVANVRHQVEIVEVGPMETGLVTTQAINEGLMLNGRVALGDIFFEPIRQPSIQSRNRGSKSSQISSPTIRQSRCTS